MTTSPYTIYFVNDKPAPNVSQLTLDQYNLPQEEKQLQDLTQGERELRRQIADTNNQIMGDREFGILEREYRQTRLTDPTRHAELKPEFEAADERRKTLRPEVARLSQKLMDTIQAIEDTDHEIARIRQALADEKETDKLDREATERVLAEEYLKKLELYDFGQEHRPIIDGWENAYRAMINGLSTDQTLELIEKTSEQTCQEKVDRAVAAVTQTLLDTKNEGTEIQRALDETNKLKKDNPFQASWLAKIPYIQSRTHVSMKTAKDYLRFANGNAEVAIANLKKDYATRNVPDEDRVKDIQGNPEKTTVTLVPIYDNKDLLRLVVALVLQGTHFKMQLVDPVKYDAVIDSNKKPLLDKSIGQYIAKHDGDPATEYTIADSALKALKDTIFARGSLSRQLGYLFTVRNQATVKVTAYIVPYPSGTGWEASGIYLGPDKTEKAIDLLVTAANTYVQQCTDRNIVPSLESIQEFATTQPQLEILSKTTTIAQTKKTLQSVADKVQPRFFPKQIAFWRGGKRRTRKNRLRRTKKCNRKKNRLTRRRVRQRGGKKRHSHKAFA